jgi:hypothetical protein
MAVYRCTSFASRFSCTKVYVFGHVSNIFVHYLTLDGDVKLLRPISSCEYNIQQRENMTLGPPPSPGEPHIEQVDKVLESLKFEAVDYENCRAC